MAWIRAWSSGGKSGLSTTPGTVRNRKISRHPAPSPPLDLTDGQADLRRGLLDSALGPLMQDQREPRALPVLNRDGPSANRRACGLKETFREGTRGGSRSWHGGVHSSPKRFLNIPPLIPKDRSNYDVICETDH
jgi:hypothetical protein